MMSDKFWLQNNDVKLILSTLRKYRFENDRLSTNFLFQLCTKAEV